MPSRRKSSRPAQSQPQPAQSDYDTDTANLTEHRHAIMAAVPAPPVRSIDELNLLVLRRWYPEVELIIAIAPYAVIYNLNRAVGEWEKAETEGSLFVCQLTPNPYERYRVIILNRKSTENFTMDLVSAENISFQSGFIIAQTAEDDATGIWVFSDGRAEVTTAEVTWNVIESCAKRVEQFGQLEEEVEEGVHGFDEETYEMDGGIGAEAETEHHNQLPTALQLPPATTGRQIDLASLFAKPHIQPQTSATFAPQPGVEIQPKPGNFPIDTVTDVHPSHFTATADTDFFRGSHSPATLQRQQPVNPGTVPAPASQQNALLDLFKNARRA